MDEERPLLTIKTKYNEEEYIKFNRFHILIKDNKIKKYLVFNILVLILVIVYLLYKYYLASFFLSILVAIFDIILMTSPKKGVKKFIKSDKLFGKFENTVNFYDSTFEVINDKSISKIDYSDLHKAYLVKNNFYLYLNERSAVLILRKDITVEDVDKLERILEDKMKDKFIKIN